jgi:hypothetical protein
VLTTAINTKLQVGDVVILKDPFRPEQRICKRVIGNFVLEEIVEYFFPTRVARFFLV